MPEKSLTIAAYAAGASLTAAALVYVFGPTFFLDEQDVSQHDRRRIAVGLRNDANDCFINSTLQALAGLPTLRLYLIREIHLRQQDGEEIYEAVGTDEKSKIEKSRPDWLRLSLQSGTLTVALKEMLDTLNERPTARKTTTAQPFVTAVELAFKTKVSRYQQDAQEFLQLIMERLADEHNIWLKARKRAGLDEKDKASQQQSESTVDEKHDSTMDTALQDLSLEKAPPELCSSALAFSPSLELVFEGKISSQIECLTCHFQPKAADTTFVTLTLNVPHNLTSTSLDACLDGMLKVEHIDDFKCDRCRLEHALEIIAKSLEKHNLSAQDRQTLEERFARVQKAIDTDPEHPPKDLELPDVASAPKRRIARHMRISLFPKVLAVHLSRSVWDSNYSSFKNTAKVAFPEKLYLGSLLDRKEYRLMSMITHKGGHNSGHYETFRRQWVAPPAAVDARPGTADTAAPLPENKTPEPCEEVEPTEAALPLGSPKLPLASSVRFRPAASPRLKATSQAKLAEKKRKAQDKWWRISDEKVKESKSSDVLSMQKEVYLLFYEMVV